LGVVNENVRLLNPYKLGNIILKNRIVMAPMMCSRAISNIPDATDKVLIEYPSKKNWSAELRPMMSHFERGLTLNEKGKYNFKVVVVADGVPKEKQFKYTVKY
jgi:hypothetical protein